MYIRAFLRLAAVPALLLFLGMLTATAASAPFSVTGGTAAQQALLARAYNDFPACCRTSPPVCVCLLDNGSMNACLQKCAAAQAQKLVNADAVDGFYQNSSPTITLRVPTSTSDVSAVFTHEYGHFIWLNVLSPTQRDQYRTLYKVQFSSNHLVSKYAAVSVEEGFAEAFSHYMRDRAFLAKRDSPSNNFLSSVLNTPTKQ